MSGFRRISTKRAALLASTALCMAPFLTALPAAAQDATWLNAPGSGDFNTPANWSPASVPTGTAFFDTSATTSLSIGTANVGGWTFNAGASNYSFTTYGTFEFSGAGIAVNGGSATITNNIELRFNNTSSAGGAAITNAGGMFFLNISTAGSAAITDNNFLVFNDASSAGNAAITNAALGFTDFSQSTGPLGDNKLSAGSIAGGGIFRLGQNELSVGGNNLSTNVTAFIGDGGIGGGTGGRLIKTGTGTMTLSGANTYTGGTTISAGTLQIGNGSTTGSVLGNITNNAALIFNRSDAIAFGNVIGGSGTLEKLGAGTLTLSGTNTYTGATTVNGGTLEISGSIASATVTNNTNLAYIGTATAGNAAITNGTSGTTDFSLSTGPLGDHKLSAGSLRGGGTFNLGANELTVGGNNLSTNVSGIIADGGLGGGTGASLVKIGSGTMALSGINTYTGATTVNSGRLAISGSIASSTITNNATLAFINAGTAGSASITNNATAILDFVGSTAGSATISNDGLLNFYNTGTAASAAITNNNALLFRQTSTAGNAAITNGALGNTDFSFSTGPAGDNKLSAGSLDGGGTYNLGANELTVGGNNGSTNVTGIIADGGANGGTGARLIKAGSGTMTLSGANTYTGGTTISAGTLEVQGGTALSDTGAVTIANVTGARLLVTQSETIGSLSGGGLAGGAIETGASQLTVNQTVAGTFAGIISGGGAVTKTGAETLTLSGASTYSGITTVSGGTLEISGSIASGTVTNNANLAYIGTATAGSAGITNDSVLEFRDNSSAGGAGITNNAFGQFFDSSRAGSSAIANNGILVFSGSSSADSATITNPITAILQFYETSRAGTATITNGNLLEFRGASSADGATITNNNLLEFFSNSSAGSAAITNGSTLRFRNSSSAGGATITNNSTLEFLNTSTAGGAGITNGSNLQFFNTASAGNATIVNNDFVGFNDASSAGGAAITNLASLWFRDTSSAGGAGITNSSNLQFFNTASAGNATIVNNATVGFNDASSAGSAAITNNSFAHFLGSSTALTATITNFDAVRFFDNASAGSATITNAGAGSLEFLNTSSASSANIANNAILLFSGASSAGTATIVNNNVLQFLNTSTAGNAAITNGVSGNTDFSQSTGPASDNKLSAGSLAGGGTFNLGARELTVGGNNLSTSVTGVIADGGGGGGTGAALIKTGTGTLTLSGTNTYTGVTAIDAGTLRVDGSITASSGVTVNNGGTLAGTGTVGNTIVNGGGTLAAGIGAGSSLNVTGSLALQAGAFYMVQINPTTSSFTNVTGTAALNSGATVQASFTAGTYVAKQYTILHTSAGVTGQFNDVVTNTNLPSGFKTTISYGANDVYLDLALAFIAPPGSGLSGNQQGVGNAIIGFFNSTGSIPLVFGGLTAAGLTQISGETAAGSQATTFGAMNQFMGILTDPFTAGRADGPNAPAYAEEDVAANAYASSGRPRSNNEREAHAAVYSRAPVAVPFVARWNVWGAGFGGSQTTDGNTTLGSSNTTSRLYGVAAGADYFFSPNTVAGFALAGGGTSYSVAGGGRGRSDLFQAGAFIKHTIGQAYVTGALAYGWQDVTTDRTVTVAGIDRLRAQFNANAFSGRAEAGYRFVSPWIGGVGITPYAAGQFTTFDLPAYTEHVVSGANTFALAYGAKSTTATRSELGLRADRSFALQTAILTLRGRAAWAHDFNPDRAVGATFQTLPGASFVVNGARQASDAALTTASAEVKWMNGWSATGTFEGEFSNVTRSYAGKGAFRYSW